MADEIVFYCNPMSRARIARWMLEEVGAPYRAEVLDYGPPMKSAEYRAVNPMGKVPAIKHGEVVVTEGAAICAYLADAFPEAGLAPAIGSPERGTYYRWLFFGAGPLEQAVTAKSLDLLPPAEKSGMVGFGDYDTMVDALETAIAGRDYILGDRFSAADVYVGSQIVWGAQFGTLPARDSFQTYADRLTARPAYQKAKAEDDRLVEEAKAGG